MPDHAFQFLKTLHHLTKLMYENSALDQGKLKKFTSLIINGQPEMNFNYLVTSVEELALNLTSIYDEIERSTGKDTNILAQKITNLSIYNNPTFVYFLEKQSKVFKDFTLYLLALENTRSAIEFVLNEKFVNKIKNIFSTNLDQTAYPVTRTEVTKEAIQVLGELAIETFDTCSPEISKLSKDFGENWEILDAIDGSQTFFETDLISADIDGIASRIPRYCIGKPEEIRGLVNKILRPGAIYRHVFISAWVEQEGEKYPDFIRWLAVVENQRIATLAYLDSKSDDYISRR